MKKLTLTTIVCISSVVYVVSQTTNQSETTKLSQEIDTLYKQNKIEKAIDVAEKLVAMQQQKSDTSVSYAEAISTLANLQTEQLRIRVKTGLENQSNDREFESKRFTVWRAENEESAEKAEKFFRQALRIYNLPIENENLQTATIKGQLAWILFHFRGKRVFTIDDVRPRIDEIESLYLQAIAPLEKLLGKNNDLTLRTYIEIADFYLNYVNFEKALPFYELYQIEIEKKLGKNDKKLLKCLYPIARILTMTEQKIEAAEIKQRIFDLTGRNEKFTQFNLTSRRKDLLGQNYIGKEIKKGKAVKVEILVDENGKIIEAKANSDKQKVEAETLKLSVRPFIYNNVGRKLRGYYYYILD